MKITVIGAGSLGLTAELARAVAGRDELRGARLGLMDLDPGRLELAARYTRRVAAESGGAFRVEASADRAAALEGADFVLPTVAIGGIEMRRHDVAIPRKHGIVQIKADTTGPAGIFRGLRGIPFAVDLARDMERHCPDGLLVNLSNPLTVLCRAVHRASTIAAVGVCSCIDDMRWDMASKMGVPPASLGLESIGVNHFTWMTGIWVDGRDARELFEARVLPDFRKGLPVTADLYDAYGRFPIPGYKYASEFFPHFVGPGTRGGADLGFEPVDPEVWAAAANETRAAMERELSDTGKLPARRSDRLMDNVADLMVSVHTGKPGVHNLNVPNQGRLGGLPREAVLEGPVWVSGARRRALVCAPLPARIERLLHRVVQEQELVVQAGLEGDREALYDALLLDPLVPSPAVARALMDEMIRAEREYLPRFAP